MKERLCPDCLRPAIECECAGTDKFKKNPLKTKLEAWGITNPSEFIAQCVKHGRVHEAKPDPMRCSEK